MTDRSYTLSPDGNWSATTVNKDFQSFVQMISASDPQHVITSPSSEGYQWMEAWSPDSTAVAVVRSTHVGAPCSNRSVIIYSLADDQKSLTPYPFEPYPYDPEEEAGHCLRFAWSPDSTQYFASFVQNEFFIVNRAGQSIHQVVIDMDIANDIASVEWTTAGLFYVFRQHGETPGPLIYELRKVNLDDPNDYEILFQNTGLNIIGSAADASRLLLVTYDREDDPYKFHLLVLDIRTKQIEKRIDGIGYLCGTADSQGAGLTVLHIAEPDQPCGGRVNLWIFDWESGQYFMYGPIDTLLGWRVAEQGFAVINKTGEEEYEIAIVPASELITSDN